jgi:hypothetical protein
VTASDALRPPSRGDLAAFLAKDWLHLNVFDHGTGVVGLVNTSLHGQPGDHRAFAAGAVLFHSPELGWMGDARVTPMRDAVIGVASVAFDWLAFAVSPATGAVAASVRLPGSILLNLEASPATEPVEVDARVPFGSGWISWYIVPRLTVRGSLRLGGAGDERNMDGASAYHDHNWGRWAWGEDIGWEWAVCVAEGDGPVFELSRATNRSHRSGTTSLIVLINGRRRIYRGAALAMTRTGRLGPPERRVPGALASLHADRRQPVLPRQIRIALDDGLDRATIDISVTAAAQLILAEPTQPGTSFIHEMTGTFRCSGQFSGRRVDSSGLAVFEHAD